MIYEEESKIKVERVERRMWAETISFASLSFFLATYFLSLAAGRPIIYLVVIGLVVVGATFLFVGVRRRSICVIESDRVGYGFLGGEMQWLERDRIRLVTVRRNFLFEINFYDQEENLLARTVLPFFDPKELRQAFEVAGISVR